MADPWRNCAASMTLVAEINARWPRRDKASDGTIGDPAHAARTSDHNPWIKKAPPPNMGIVRARDIDVDGVDMAWLMEHLRRLGARGDARLVGGGYLIFNQRITKPDFSGWRTYTGSNPHTSHGHVSLTRDPRAFDSTEPWGIAAAPAVRPLERFLMALSDAEQRELLDATRKLVGWLSMPSFVPPGADPSKPWTVNPGQALLNLYVGMFFGGSSTGNRSLFQHIAAAGGSQVDTAAVVAGVVDALTEHGIAGPVADELARRLSVPPKPTVKESP